MRARMIAVGISKRCAWSLCALALVACNATDDAKDAGDGNTGGKGGNSTGSAGSAAGGKGGAAAGKGGNSTGSAGSAGSAAGGKGGGSAGSAGTAGGTMADAGSAGSAGAAGGTMADAGSAPCSPCIGDVVSWGPNGGFVAFTENSAFTDCNTYRHTRMPAGRGDPTQASLECERPVPCMGSGLHGIADVLQALDHPDVEAARAKGSVLFGTDSRPVDGQVFRIELARSAIEVGGQCTMSASCNAIPAGVQALVDLLHAIDDEQLHIEPCAGMFQ